MGLKLIPAAPIQSQLSAGDLSFGLAPAADANPLVPMPMVDFGMGSAAAAPASTSAGSFGMTYGSPLSVGANGINSLLPQSPAGTGNNNQPLSQAMTWGTTPFANRVGMVMDGIGMLGKLWSAFQANKIAKESLDFQKKAYKTNLANETKSYNTALEDRANSRAAYMDRVDPNAQATAAAYIERNRLGA